MLTVLKIVLLQFIPYIFAQNDAYTAAVIEYTPIGEGMSPPDKLKTNADEHIRTMAHAYSHGAEIILFPENSLTGWNIPTDQLDEISTAVPDPDSQISPCDVSHHTAPGYPTNYSKFFVDLSCAARKHRMYTVINLIEHDHKDGSYEKIFYNTNVVFDRNGHVIARYRKINLYNEPYYHPGDKPSIFKTDFGVTFAIFTSFDILFQNPALDVLDNPLVTDILYSSAWVSELPFLQANSLQHGFAKSNGVNLLAAGLNDPAHGYSGSGIYLSDGRIVESYLASVRETKIIIKSVKVGIRKNLSNTCQSSTPSATQFRYSLMGSFHSKTSNMDHYTFKSLDLNQEEISETVCVSNSPFCCSFNISLSKTGKTPNYTYKLVAFYGAYQASSTKTLGVRNCGLIACLNENNDSCGGRHNQFPTVLFRSIVLQGIFDHTSAYDQPATLNFDLKPSSDYTYCTNTTNNQIEVTISTTKEHNSVLTFGLFSRIFKNDQKPEGPLDHNGIPRVKSAFIVLVLSVALFVL